ncbi:ankyrin repeats (3 copies) family protein [Penicillium viridicatum]|nr:ankyrin repeats (3 copies) family protein [Penicillium viridicatum]
MKLSVVISLFVTAALAVPLDGQFNDVAKRCGVGRRSEIFHAVRSAVDTVKVKRELNEIDVDEISAALYSSWCTP